MSNDKPIIKTVRLEINSCKINIDKNITITYSMKELTKELNSLQKDLSKACNYAARMYYDKIINQEDIDTKGITAYMRELCPMINSGGIDQTIVSIKGEFAGEKKKELLLGKRILPSYKKDVPIDIRNQGINNICKVEKGYEITLSIFSNNYKKTKEKSRIVCVKNPGTYEKKILNNIISNKYTSCNARLQQDKKGKWYLMLSYKYENNKEVDIVPRRILGVDLGIVNAVAFQIRDIEKNELLKLDPTECLKDGTELRDYRLKKEGERKALLKLSKIGTNSSIGHGRLRRTQARNRLSDKISDFRSTFNYTIAYSIVDYAIKYNCNYIQMEDLSGYKSTDKVLKDWTHFDLRLKIENKCKENGIVFKLIKPGHTSQMCNKCHHIDPNNRDRRNFKCTNCGYEADADLNAAANLTIPDVDAIINVYLEEKKKEKEKIKKTKVFKKEEKGAA